MQKNDKLDNIWINESIVFDSCTWNRRVNGSESGVHYSLTRERKNKTEQE